MKRILYYITVLVLALGCQKVIQVSAVFLSRDSMEIFVDEERELLVVFSPSDATNKIVEWHSSDPAVVEVDDGIIRGVSAGKAVITAKALGTDASAKCKVIVNERQKPLMPAVDGLEDYLLVWNDEFDEESLNLEKWSLSLSRGMPNPDVRYAANEDHVFVRDGNLNIVLSVEKGDSIPTSSMIVSQERWLKGYFEGRVLIPSGKGTWPAFWLAPWRSDWPLTGEVDILEAVGFAPEYTHHVIWSSKYRNNEYMVDYYLPDAQNSYHIYACEITDEYVDIYVDGVKVLTYENDHTGAESWPYSEWKQKVLIDLCWGGSWAGSEGLDFECLPATMKVDYIRVFQKQ